ncbi:MAG: nucleoside monophosphate kinase [archaeon]|nr:nucleoside monophosphate kinase [archaeon]
MSEDIGTDEINIQTNYEGGDNPNLEGTEQANQSEPPQNMENENQDVPQMEEGPQFVDNEQNPINVNEVEQAVGAEPNENPEMPLNEEHPMEEEKKEENPLNENPVDEGMENQNPMEEEKKEENPLNENPEENPNENEHPLEEEKKTEEFEDNPNISPNALGTDINNLEGTAENEEESEGSHSNQNVNEMTQNATNNKSEESSADQIGDFQSKYKTVLKLYKHKLKVLRRWEPMKIIYDKFWDLLPHTLEGEISKESFILLFSKIYKVLLPIFNYSQIDKFVEGQWLIFSKEKETMPKKNFVKSLFNIAHMWTTHISKDEYEDFLSMLYKRLTKKRKIKKDGIEIFKPFIKVKFYDTFTAKEYDTFTWEYVTKEEDPTHKNIYEFYEEKNKKLNTEEEKKDDEELVSTPKSASANNNKERPKLCDGNINLYDQKNPFIIYDEEVFYKDEEAMETLDLNEYLEDVLLEDEEIIILGYPTQFILNKFLNNISDLENTETAEDSPYDCEFNITDYKPYEDYKFYLKINSKEKLLSFLKENTKFTLCRDSYIINNYSFGEDFVEDECNIHNNLRMNPSLNRYIDMYEIKLQGGTKIKANLDNLILNPTFKKAFGNILKDKKTIGIKSKLWDQSIEDIMENIIDRKFRLIHIKLLNLALNYDLYEDVFITIREEMKNQRKNKLSETKGDFAFFKKFESKMGIKFDNWDSDNDLYDEANKKSPVVLVVGPPLIGKTSVAEKLSKDLEMVLLEPKKFFEGIFQKVADFEEKMQSWDENEGAEENNEGGEEGEGEEKKEKKKKQKPTVDSVLNPVEFAVYDDITNGRPISELNMQRMYMYLLHTDLALSRGVVIDMNSNIFPKTDDPNNDTDCFVAKLLKGYYGNVEIDYVVDLNINKEELIERKNSMKFNLKTLRNITPREIELIKKPKVQKKEILEDEIEYDEEGKPVIPEGMTMEDLFPDYEKPPPKEKKKRKKKKKVEGEDAVAEGEEEEPQGENAEGENNEEGAEGEGENAEGEEGEAEEAQPEEEQPAEPEPEPELDEETLEKLPKKGDLLDIPDLDEIFEQKYEYYENVQYPKVLEYAKTLKTNYYIKLDVTGLDYDEISDLIKSQLDFANPLRPIAKVLEGGDLKTLLTDGREGVLPYRRWSPWKQEDPVALKDDFLLLQGSTEFPAVYFGRVFLFVTEENRKKFLENPKKYINEPPKVPINYRISIIGPSKSGKSTIAQMLSELYGWKIMDMEDIYEKVKEYQKNWEEPELNSVYTRRIHFSAQEFKEVLANAAKKPADRKPDNFVSKIVFMLDSMGIPMDKRKTREEFFEERKYHRDKLAHLFNRMKEAKEREEQEKEDERIRLEEEEAEKKRVEEERIDAEKKFEDMTECARCQYEIVMANNAKVYEDHVLEKEEKKKEMLRQLEIKEAQNPFPAEEEYVIEDLKSDQFHLAYDNEGKQQRVNGIILMNHPFSEEEYEKLKDFNILMDKVIYIKDEADEALKALALRRNPNLNLEGLDEEKAMEKLSPELEKIKNEQGKLEEIIGVLREKYTTNNEDCVIEVGYNEPMESLKLKLINALNPFSIRLDKEESIIPPADVNPEEKFAISKGPFGLFCPVIYKEDNWLYYCTEENEVQVNQRLYRLAGEEEKKKFEENPGLYLGENGSMIPIDVPPPHIMITGYQGSGITYFSNILCKEFKLTKREIQKEFLEIWEKQKADRKAIRVKKKIEELEKQNQEIEEKNKETLKENPEAEPEPLVDINDAIANDAALDEEDPETYVADDNDKKIFKSLFQPLTPTIYDASWNNMEEKVAKPFLDLLLETRRVPNVMVVFKVNLKSIMERHFHLDQIEEEYEKMLKISNDKRKQREEELIKQKQQEAWEKLKEEIEAEQEQEGNEEGEEGAEGEAEGEPEGEAEGEEAQNEGEEGEVPEEGQKKRKKKKRKLPEVSQMKVELEPEEKEDIWNSPDPDLIEKDTLIQQEKDKLTTRLEANVNAIQTLIDTLKEKGIPVIEITNDTTKENVYKNLIYELRPYIKNRKNLIEKQLINDRVFPEPLLLRKVRDLTENSEVYLQSVYNKLSPIDPSKMIIRTDYPLIYRDRVYLFNKEEEKKEFSEYPLDYRSGLECPKDCYPMRGRTIIFVIGQTCSGKTTLSKILSEYMGYKIITLKKSFNDLSKKLHDCSLKKEIEEALKGGSFSDDLSIRVLQRRITLEDMINQNLVIDGFPSTLTQANMFPEELKPDFVFISECDLQTNIERAFQNKEFKGKAELISEKMKDLNSHLTDIIKMFRIKKYEIRRFDMTKSKWYIKDLIHNVLEERRKSEMLFARNLSLNKPCPLTNLIPFKLRDSIILETSNKGKLFSYSPVALKSSGLFKYNKYKNNIQNNKIIYTPLSEKNKFHLLTNEEEVKQFMNSPDYYKDYIDNISLDTVPPKALNFEELSEILYKDPVNIKNENESIDEEDEKEAEPEQMDDDNIMKLQMEIKFEYEECCPVTIVEDKLTKKGKTCYVAEYQKKYFKFLSVEKMKKFLVNPTKYMNLKLPVKKVNKEENLLTEKQIDFSNTVNFLEFTFGSLITKGMFELSKNKIIYPYLDVKETSLKYLALYLKANNPNNNEYEKKKYNEILKEFIRNSKLPFELLNVYNNYMKEKDNPLHKMLIRKQLDTVAEKYDRLMEKAKIQNNTRFENFFRRQYDTGNKDA